MCLKLIMSDNSEIYIHHRDVWKGIKHSVKYSKSLINNSELLRRKFQYQAAIPLACLSLEESSKCAHLCKFHDEKIDITKNYWRNNFLNHNKKLEYYIKELLCQQLLSVRIEYEQINKRKGNTILTNHKLRMSNLSNILKEVRRYVVHLNNLKLLCFYPSWNETNKKWISFEDIPDKMHLTDFVIGLSKMFRNWSMSNIEQLLEKDLTLEPDMKQCNKCYKICMNTDKCSSCNDMQLNLDSDHEYRKICRKAMDNYIKITY